MKSLAIVNQHGLPLSVSPHAANHHKVTLVRHSFVFYMLEAKPISLASGPMTVMGSLEGLQQDWVTLIVPITPAASAGLSMVGISGVTNAVGLWSGSLPGSSGIGAS